MRVVVFFDLPTISLSDKREYRKFRKLLISSGFIMAQESVYTKIALNTSVANSVIESIRKSSPTQGIVQLLLVTEKQYNRMEYIVGSGQSEIIDSDERLVIL